MRKPFRILAVVATALALAAAGRAPAVDFLISDTDFLIPDITETSLEPALPPLPEDITAFVEPDLGVVLPEADTLSQLVRDLRTIDSPPLDDQTRCLATTVYYESMGEPLDGQLAVAQVVLNRVVDGRFGKDICSVVTAPKQFSFVRGGTLIAPAKNAQWQVAKAIALIAVSNSWPEVVPAATHFHATRVNPGWRLQRIATVGRHVFYR